MSVTRIIELNASSHAGIEDAVRRGPENAAKTVRNIRGAWINGIEVATAADGGVAQGRVNMRIG